MKKLLSFIFLCMSLQEIYAQELPAIARLSHKIYIRFENKTNHPFTITLGGTYFIVDRTRKVLDSITGNNLNTYTAKPGIVSYFGALKSVENNSVYWLEQFLTGYVGTAEKSFVIDNPFYSDTYTFELHEFNGKFVVYRRLKKDDKIKQ